MVSRDPKRCTRPTRCSISIGFHGTSRCTRRRENWRLIPSPPARDEMRNCGPVGSFEMRDLLIPLGIGLPAYDDRGTLACYLLRARVVRARTVSIGWANRTTYRVPPVRRMSFRRRSHFTCRGDRTRSIPCRTSAANASMIQLVIVSSTAFLDIFDVVVVCLTPESPRAAGDRQFDRFVRSAQSDTAVALQWLPGAVPGLTSSPRESLAYQSIQARRWDSTLPTASAWAHFQPAARLH